MYLDLQKYSPHLSSKEMSFRDSLAWNWSSSQPPGAAALPWVTWVMGGCHAMGYVVGSTSRQVREERSLSLGCHHQVEIKCCTLNVTSLPWSPDAGRTWSCWWLISLVAHAVAARTSAWQRMTTSYDSGGWVGYHGGTDRHQWWQSVAVATRDEDRVLIYRVPSHSGNKGKPWKWVSNIPVRERSGNLGKTPKIRGNSGNLWQWRSRERFSPV